MQVAPSFSNSPRTVGKIHPLSSALRIRVSIIAMIDRGLCPLDTHKPLKRLDLNFSDFPFRQVFTHAGVLAVFKPRRGRLKIPVAPTGKLKLHVFPLRRAKENKHFGRFFEVRKVEYNRGKSRSEIAGCIVIPKGLYFSHGESCFSI